MNTGSIHLCIDRSVVEKRRINLSQIALTILLALNTNKIGMKTDFSHINKIFVIIQTVDLLFCFLDDLLERVHFFPKELFYLLSCLRDYCVKMINSRAQFAFDVSIDSLK